MKWLEIAGQARNDGGGGNDRWAMTAGAGGGGSRAPALRWHDRRWAARVTSLRPLQVRGDTRNLALYGDMVAALTPPYTFRGTRRGELCSPAEWRMITVIASLTRNLPYGL